MNDYNRFLFLNCINEIVKNINPIILESGQIERDLKVGDKKITNDKAKR